MERIVAVVAVVATALGWEAPAFAAETAKSLDYAVEGAASAECPDASGFAESVAARLGYDPFSPDAKGVLHARIRPNGKALAGTIEIVDEAGASLGTKALASARCDDLVAAMSFAASMAIDPASTLVPKNKRTQPPPSSTPTAAETPPDANEEPIPPPAPPPPASHRHLEPELAVAVGPAVFGPVAGVALDVAAGVGLRYGAASVDLEARYQTPSSTSVSSLTGGNVVTSTVGASLVPCAHLEPIFLCAEGFLGALQGKAEGVVNEQGGSTVFAQAGIRGGVSIPLSRALRLEPFASALVTLTPTTLKFSGEDVWTTGAAGLVGGLRLSIVFRDDSPGSPQK